MFITKQNYVLFAYKITLEFHSWGLGNMAQQLRALVFIALAEDPGLVLSNFMVIHKPFVSLVPGNLTPSSGFWRYQAYACCTYIHACTHTYKK